MLRHENTGGMISFCFVPLAGSAACRFANVVDGDDVRVIQRRCGFRLANNAMQPVAVDGELGWEHLERDAAVEACVLGEIHLAHPALAESGHDLVVAQLGALVHLHVE
jgi:hypothetical protein